MRLIHRLNQWLKLLSTRVRVIGVDVVETGLNPGFKLAGQGFHGQTRLGRRGELLGNTNRFTKAHRHRTVGIGRKCTGIQVFLHFLNRLAHAIEGGILTKIIAGIAEDAKSDDRLVRPTGGHSVIDLASGI